MSETISLSSYQVQMTARIKELRRLVSEHYAEISRLEQETSQLMYQRSISAPQGRYRHQRRDGSEVEVDATVLETDGDALCIEYRIPRFLARRGEEDGYLLWLSSPDERARFTPRT